jgi:DNA-binding MarR family transcriptional regulator
MEPVRKERAVDSAFADSLYFAGGAFTRALEKVAADCWKPSGLTPSQGNLLLHLIDNFSSFSYFISSDLRVNPSSVSRLADQLQAKGLIDRFTENHWTYLSATRKAVELCPLLTKCEKAFSDKCAELLGEKVAKVLANSLNEATDKLTARKANQNVLQQTENPLENPELGN